MIRATVYPSLAFVSNSSSTPYLSPCIVLASNIAHQSSWACCLTFANPLCGALKEHSAPPTITSHDALVQQTGLLGSLAKDLTIDVAIACAQLAFLVYRSASPRMLITYILRLSSLICLSHIFCSSSSHQSGTKIATTHHLLVSSFPSPGLAFCQSLLCPSTSTS